MVLVVPVSALCPLLALMCELGLHNKREVGGIKKQVLFAIWKAEGSKIKETGLAANGALLSDLERSTVLYAFRWFPAVQVQKILLFFSSPLSSPTHLSQYWR